jgi:ABC-type arginine/histidine transport system permease subunit
MRHIVLPQALRMMIPPTIGVYVSTIKESSLASIIGFVELLGQGMAIREANSLRNTADVLVAVAFGYFVICFSLSQLGRYLEHRTMPRSRPVRERGGVTAPGSLRAPLVANFRSPASIFTASRRRVGWR